MIGAEVTPFRGAGEAKRRKTADADRHETSRRRSSDEVKKRRGTKLPDSSLSGSHSGGLRHNGLFSPAGEDGRQVATARFERQALHQPCAVGAARSL